MQGVRLIVLYYCLTIQILCGLSATLTCLNNLNTITVSQDGQGNFAKIQDAINSIPSGNNRWIRIHINPGSYREQVRVPIDKQCVILEGQDYKTTRIVFDGHDATDSSATFVSGAENFVARNIAFVNNYNNPGQGAVPNGQVKQAVAITVIGDHSAFYNCGFYGYQDTLWAFGQRHFYKNCFIEGAIDFIWGNATAFFEDCTINVIGSGCITGQNRGKPEDPTGFVFYGGSVIGNTRTILGRALNPHSRVIFQNTKFANIIDPLGWDANGHKPSGLIFAESQCSGEGSNRSGRVPWVKNVDSHLSKYSRKVFVDQDNWIGQQPS